MLPRTVRCLKYLRNSTAGRIKLIEACLEYIELIDSVTFSRSSSKINRLSALVNRRVVGIKPLFGFGLVCWFLLLYTHCYYGQEHKMKYYNGQLRNELDDTLCIRPKVHKLNWKECAPFVVLALLMVGLLMNGLIS